MHNPLLKEAVVRSGELLGRYYDRVGEVDAAVEIYTDIMSIEQDSLVARRLVVLLSRRGQLREAAKIAETAIISRPNLFQTFSTNRHLASLKAELSQNGP